MTTIPRQTATTATAPRKPAGLLRAALRTRRTQVGLILATLVVATAVLGPVLAPHTSTSFVGPPFAPHADGTVFGTDSLGRDVLSRFLHGGLLLLSLALASTVIGVGFGTVIGLAAGYSRGRLDDLLMRTNDVLLALPELVLSLLFLSIVGPKLWLLVVITGFAHMPRTARVIRESTRRVVEQDFVKAAESIGVRRWRILGGEILPNVTSSLAVEFGLRATYSITILAGLSFLGVGLQPPTAAWGLMINANRVAITVQPWAVVLPVCAIALLTVGVNMITDGIARAAVGIDRGVRA